MGQVLAAVLLLKGLQNFQLQLTKVVHFWVKCDLIIKKV